MVPWRHVGSYGVLMQVCEHFEEVCAIATEGPECCSAAWLCVSLLMPRHLLRLLGLP